MDPVGGWCPCRRLNNLILRPERRAGQTLRLVEPCCQSFRSSKHQQIQRVFILSSSTRLADLVTSPEESDGDKRVVAFDLESLCIRVLKSAVTVRCLSRRRWSRPCESLAGLQIPD
jgi:hypothetical protein